MLSHTGGIDVMRRCSAGRMIFLLKNYTLCHRDKKLYRKEGYNIS